MNWWMLLFIIPLSMAAGVVIVELLVYKAGIR